MNIDYLLKKEGITNIKELETSQIKIISKDLAIKLCLAFPEHDLDRQALYNSFCALDMYIATMPKDSSGAKYIAHTNSIYFNEDLDFSSIPDVAMHECIHFIQEGRLNGKNAFVGLTSFTSGLALNEAAVQLMASEANMCNITEEKYYDIYEAIDEYDKLITEDNMYYDKTEMLKTINKLLHTNYDMKLIDEILKLSGKYWTKRVIIDEKTIRKLSEKFNLYVYTNYYTEVQENRLRNIGYLKYFKRVFGADKYGSKVFKKAFEKCDVIMIPTAPNTSFKFGAHNASPLEMYLEDIYTVPVNIAGLPGISVPGGFGKNGMPIGIQFIAKAFDEQNLLNICKAIEEETRLENHTAGGNHEL